MKCSVSISIACPLETVFDFVSNYENDPLWRAGVFSMKQEPAWPSEIGTKTWEVARFFGKTSKNYGEVVRYEPGHVIAFAGVMPDGTSVAGDRTVERVDNQTRFTYRATVELSGFLLLLAPIIAALLTRRFSADLQRLKKHLEAV